MIVRSDFRYLCDVMWIYDNADSASAVQCSVSGSDRFELLYFTLQHFTLPAFHITHSTESKVEYSSLH
jgi:hypothetical protein